MMYRAQLECLRSTCENVRRQERRRLAARVARVARVIADQIHLHSIAIPIPSWIPTGARIHICACSQRTDDTKN